MTTKPMNQNTHIAHKLWRAAQAAQHLINDGFTVLSVTVEGRNPIIEIQSVPICDRLGGAIHKVRAQAGAQRDHYVALYRHCQVQWVVSH